MTSPIPILARWTSFSLWSRRDAGARQNHVYTLYTPPPMPLYEGGQVKINAVSREAYHIPSHLLERPVLYDPHIQGSITKFERGGRGRLVATVVNECQRNIVEIVELDIPLHPEVVAFPVTGDRESQSAAEEQFHLITSNIVPEMAFVEECHGLACCPSEHEVADARIGEDVIELTDEEEGDVEETTTRKRRQPGSAARWRLSKRKRGISSTPARRR